jgi:phage terminase small subunit
MIERNPSPSAPKHLRKPTANWFRSVVKSYELEPHHVRLLQLACEAWDQVAAAREALAEHGVTFVDRFGQPRVRPEVAVERDARLAFARLLRELDLDADPPPGPSRPPALRAIRGGHAA